MSLIRIKYMVCLNIVSNWRQNQICGKMTLEIEVM